MPKVTAVKTALIERSEDTRADLTAYSWNAAGSGISEEDRIMGALRYPFARLLTETFGVSCEVLSIVERPQGFLVQYAEEE